MRLTFSDIVNLYAPRPVPCVSTCERKAYREPSPVPLISFFKRSDSGTRKPISLRSALTKTLASFRKTSAFDGRQTPSGIASQ